MKIKLATIITLPVLVVLVSVTVNILAANAQPAAFDPPVNFDGGDGMRSVVSVDLNGDGFLDLAASNERTNTVSVHLNNGDGTFAVRVEYAVGTSPAAVTAADFNRDGVPDLAVANRASNDVSVLPNNGDGTFGAKVDFPVGLEPNAVAAGDLDGDGDMDLATANLRSNTASVLLNNGDGTVFTLAEPTTVGEQPVSVVAEDLDADGDVDLAVLNRSPEVILIGGGAAVKRLYTVSLLLNHGDGTFAEEARYEVGPNPMQVIAADLDGDGDPDLATANHVVSSVAPGSWLSVLMNNGDGTFGAETRVGTDSLPNSVAAADLDNDGDLDLVAASHYTGGGIAVMINQGNGAFAAHGTMSPGAMNAPSFVTTGDYDGDGDFDLIAASDSSDNFALLLNQLVPNVPVEVGAPDLTGEVTRLKMKAKKGEYEFEFEIEVQNIGNSPADGSFGVQAYLSADQTPDGDQDMLLETWHVLAGLPAGRAEKLKARLNLSGIGSHEWLLIVVDAGNAIAEADETNNLTAQRIAPSSQRRSSDQAPSE